MVSYTRAKAEALGVDCKVGLFQRAERIVLLGLGSALFGLMWSGVILSWVIVVVAFFSLFTAIQRVVWVYRNVKEEGVPGGVPTAGPEDAAALIKEERKT
ncbi:MAG: hypothetical protein GWM92_05295 [Gemmatimonadetes bacterium]|nr:hypothetical protein [Gemmatimonadota bacterium]NIR78022.1 hypothetical protein [Gemmatimonadota bacterium]NIT86557.1 hypothetical protein [Gemmatimonadota bacterium]NIU30422.1 hypothetical protein [Gemmatimonadota bacterium]NIU35295.1 hypothetical protein [Gemmatimonadota bacterium]